MRLVITKLILAAALAAFAMPACVDEEPSMLLVGSLVLEGTVEDIAGGDEGEERQVLKCSIPGDISSANTFYSVGRINIQRLRAFGQDNPRVNLSDGDAPEYTDVRGAMSGPPGSFHFVAGFTNRLPDSRTVGATSGGGGGGGFQNMNRDGNTIQVTGARVRFAPEQNTFASENGDVSFDFEATRLFNAILESNGGSAILSFPIIQNNDELSDIESFLTDVLGTETGVVTFVAELTILGKTIAGTEVESNRLQYPIDICVSCNTQGVTPTCLP